MEIWNLNHILEGKTTEELIEELNTKVVEFKNFRNQLKADISVKKLKEIILLKEQIIVLSTKIQVYYYLKFFENTSDSVILGKMSQLNQMMTDLENDMQFFSLWYVRIDDENAKRIESSQDLKDYKYYLESLRELKSYTKSEEIERIINLKSITGAGAFSSVYEVFTGTFKYNFNGKKDLPQEKVIKYVESKDPKLREEAYKKVLGNYGEKSVVLSEIYKNIALDWYNEEIKIRGFKKPISKRNIDNEVSDEVVDVMMQVIRENASIFADYFKLKYEIIKKSGQDYPYSRYHLYAHYELGEEKKYSYEESKELVLKTYREFDERFFQAANEIFEKGHVHSHPKSHKRGGAFCFSLDNNSTPYIMLNHADSLTDLFTMMHEFGHGIHGVFSRKQVNLLYNCTLAMAETASIFGEMMLAEKLLEKSTDPEEKKKLIMQQLDRQYASIPRQAYFVLFEEYAHENIRNGISKEELDEKYMEFLKEQFGDMEIPKLFKHEWNYIPHIHNTPFYCYAYSWGNLMVLALYALYKKEGKSFVDKYVNILSAGGGAKPIDLLAKIGINPTKKEFWQGGFDIIKSEIEELRKLA